jgi:hypothetical protein
MSRKFYICRHRENQMSLLHNPYVSEDDMDRVESGSVSVYGESNGERYAKIVASDEIEAMNKFCSILSCQPDS